MPLHRACYVLLNQGVRILEEEEEEVIEKDVADLFPSSKNGGKSLVFGEDEDEVAVSGSLLSTGNKSAGLSPLIHGHDSASGSLSTSASFSCSEMGPQSSSKRTGSSPASASIPANSATPLPAAVIPSMAPLAAATTTQLTVAPSLPSLAEQYPSKEHLLNPYSGGLSFISGGKSGAHRCPLSLLFLSLHLFLSVFFSSFWIILIS